MLNVYEAFIKVQHVDAFTSVLWWKTLQAFVNSQNLMNVPLIMVMGLFLFYFLQHQKSSQWCQEHFLNYKGLLRAITVREQLRRLMNKFKVPRNSSEGMYLSQ